MLSLTTQADLESPLRSLHEAMTAQLQETFGDVVKPYAAEVDADTIRKWSLNRLAVWPVIGSCDGLKSSSVSELRMDVKWVIFVVTAGFRYEVAEGKVTVPAVHVANTVANWVLRLAYQSSWGIESGVSRVEATDLKIHNLGVGLKSTKAIVEDEGLGLYAVWGRQEIDAGSNIAPGNATLDLATLITGVIEDQTNADNPSIPIEIDLAFVALAPIRWAQRLVARVRRWWRGPGLPELAAARINETIRREFAHG